VIAKFGMVGRIPVSIPDAQLSRRSSRVTGAQVAREVGVDPAVVSKLLKGDPNFRVSAETRARVMEAVERLRYRPNFAAQRLRSTRVGAVGLIIPSFSNPAFAEIVHGAESMSHDKGVALFVASMCEASSAVKLVEDLVSSERIDGLLVAGGDTRETHDINEFLSDKDIPYLFLNRKTNTRMRSLFLDDEYAIRLLVDHLVGLGHSNIYNIAGMDTMETGRRRQAGFQVAMKRSRLPFRKSLIAEGNYTIAGGQEAFFKVMARDPKPTALVVSEFVMGIGTISAARDMGLLVPDDLSVAVLNNLEIASYLNPMLTTVGLQLRHLGAEGLELLLSRSPDEEINLTVSMRAQLFPRESTSPPQSLRKTGRHAR